MVKISIVTVCLNSDKFIGKCLLSVSEQIGVCIDHVIVDGGSVDQTRDIIKMVSPESRLFILPGSGIYDALNFGISKARANIVGILHSNDEFLSNDTLRKVCQHFADDKKLDVFCGSAVITKGDDRVNIDRYVDSQLFSRRNLMRIGFMPAHTGLFHTKEVFSLIGGYDETYISAGDFKFCFDIFFRNFFNFRFKVSREVVSVMSSGGTSSSGFKSYVRTAKEITSILREYNLRINIIQHVVRLIIKKLHASLWIVKLKKLRFEDLRQL